MGGRYRKATRRFNGVATLWSNAKRMAEWVVILKWFCQAAAIVLALFQVFLRSG